MASIMSALDQEWKRLARSPEARRQVMRWVNTDPAFTGMHDLDDVLASRRDPDLGNRVHLRLAALAPTDALAARTLLQAVLPGLVGTATLLGFGQADVLDDLVSFAWERIHSYPPHRRGAVAGNVVLDVRKRFIRQRSRVDLVPLDEIDDVLDERERGEDQVLARMLVGHIAAAHRDGYIKTALLEPVVRTRMMDEPLADVAADLGVETDVMCGRRWRGERVLRTLPLAA